MLTIKAKQMQAFEEATWLRFEDEMVNHIKAFAPKLCEVNGDAQTRVAVHQSIERARTYDFTNRGPIRLFIELSFLYGSGFDTDPQYQAISEPLRQSDDQMCRAERIYEKVIQYQDAVCGPGNAFVRRSLEHLSAYAKQPVNANSSNFEKEMFGKIHHAYPQKAAYLGNEALNMLIKVAQAKAQEYDFTATRAHAMMVVLMFAFGYACTDDPLYPWIAKTLQDDRIRDPGAHAERLEKKAVTWLDHVLAESEQGAS